MDMNHFTNHLRQGKTPMFPPGAKDLQFAKDLDARDELAEFRDQFIIPTTNSLQKKSLKPASNGTLGYAGTRRKQPLTDAKSK
jgi:hypothetical protein